MKQPAPPNSVEDGAGLRLSALQPSDAGRIFLVVEANRPHLRTWLPWVDRTLSSADTRRFLESVETGRREGRTLAYAIEEAGELRGIIGAHDIDLEERRGAIGYWLARDATGRGLATRATRLMLGILFDSLGLERVEICCAVGNEASAAIPRRLGLQLEGIRRHGQMLNGRFVDLRVHSMLAGEWRALAQDVERGL